MNLTLPKVLPTTRLIAVVFMAGGLLACQDGSAPAIDAAAEADVIMELEREWSRKFTEGDVDWIIDLHAADARQLPPGADWIVGADALRAAWEGMSNTEGLEISWEPTGAHVSPDGGMAYDYGTVSMTTADGKTTSMKYLVVWTRVGDEWKVAADMFNANEAPGM
jgi:ketosteroid isomerase-like protein